MPQPRYITSDSQMIAPGVYIKELAPAIPIRGQRNRRAAFAGQCVRGPVNKLVTCESYKRFLDVFGDRDKNVKGGAILGHVWKVLQGRRWGSIGVVRVAASAAVKASFTLETAAGGAGTSVLRVDAANPGSWANDLGVKISAASNGVSTSFNLSYRLYGKVVTVANISINGTDDNTNSLIGNDDATLIRLTKLAPGRPVNNAPTIDGADADGYVLLGQTVASFTSVAGTDGSVADIDYTGANGPMDIIKAAPGFHAIAVVGRSNTAIKTAIKAEGGDTTQRVWFVAPDDETVSISTAVTERAGFSDQRISYWFNSTFITDPFTGEEIAEEPFLFPMSIVTQTDPDIHVGDLDNASLTKAARRVQNELDSTDRDTLTAAGISFMLHDQDQSGNDVIMPGNAVTCDFTPNNSQLDGRYMKDFVIDAIAQRLRGDQFKGNTPANRADRASAVSTFLSGLARNDRYILRDEQGVPQFSYINNSSVNSVDDQSDGIQRESLNAKLIPKNIKLELNAAIGTDATVTEQ